MLDSTSNRTAFLSGGGEMGARMRVFDWSITPIGVPENWPPALRAALRILLNTNHPVLIWWGPELVQFYNDGFSGIIGPNIHTDALGKSGRKYWREIWDIIGPDVERVISGSAIWREHQLMPTSHQDKSRHHYWTYSFSPIEDEDGRVGGIFVICRDETEEYRTTLALRAREAELARVQQIGKIGGWR